MKVYLRTFALTERDSMAYVFGPEGSERPFAWLRQERMRQ